MLHLPETSGKNHTPQTNFKMRWKCFIFLSAFLSLVSCTETRSRHRLTTSACPENWITIGTGCYLFAIPEILKIDGSCKVDGMPFLSVLIH